MMQRNLLQLYPGRPPIIVDDNGWIIYLSIHDYWHIKRRAFYKRKIKKSRNKIKWIFYYKSWMQREIEYYNFLRISIPNWSKNERKVEQIKKTYKLSGKSKIRKIRKTNCLDKERANEIRKYINSKEYKSFAITFIAKKYNVTERTIIDIINNEIWK